MGCDYYRYESELIRFSEMDDTVSCLCTFPHNDMEHLDLSRVRSLAMLGAAIVLIHHDEIEGPVYLPNNLPKWIITELERILPGE